MCGIIGIISSNDVAWPVFDGLKRLEYRGYDSAGIATLHDGQIQRRRAQGKLENLRSVLMNNPLPGQVGIGHTRWATHGAPNETNAHPHATDKVAVVHNGIIENYSTLKAELLAAGHVFTSDTDTEVIAHLLTHLLSQGLSPKQAMQQAMNRLHGAFALAVVFTDAPQHLYGARRGSPLVVGYGDGEMYLGSDALALASLTQKISYLEENDWLILSRDSAEIFDLDGKPVERRIDHSGLSGVMIGKGHYRHFMEKEIFEQPTVLGDTLQTFLHPADKTLRLPEMPFDLSDIREISIVACGTSYHAGFAASYWLEHIAGLRTSLHIASEFRYKPYLGRPDILHVFISQSGETADTLAALKHVKAHGGKTLGVVNVPSSSLAREADAVLVTQAGPEIGVASTKAFTTQLMVLAILAIYLGVKRQHISQQEEQRHTQALLELPEQVLAALACDAAVQEIARDCMTAQDVLYIGRGTSYAIALEGALKLKELSYIHAEGLAAGELKHGTIALIDEHVPVIAIAPHDHLFEKTASNVQEIMARGGRIILLSDAGGIAAFTKAGNVAHALSLPLVPDITAPMLYSIPIQLLAYHIAVLKGTDVDQPRNLAKSVTVE